MENNTQRNKTFAKSEREQLRELFKERAANPPIPKTIFGYDPEWEAYVEEMRGLEAALRAAGEVL